MSKFLMINSSKEHDPVAHSLLGGVGPDPATLESCWTRNQLPLDREHIMWARKPSFSWVNWEAMLTQKSVCGCFSAVWFIISQTGKVSSPAACLCTMNEGMCECKVCKRCFWFDILIINTQWILQIYACLSRWLIGVCPWKLNPPLPLLAVLTRDTRS